MRTGAKLLLVAAGVAAAGVLIGLYTSKLSTDAGSAAYTVPVAKAGPHPVVNLTIQTVGALGPNFGGHNPDWVSYLVQGADGKWRHDTVWKLPAHATVHMTVYQYDSASGLRNPYYGRPQGIDGNTISLDGKTTDVVNPNDASHTFAIPAYGLIVALPGIADSAKNQCSAAPCTLAMAHRTVKFTFHTGSPGHFRWQCFVPCAAGWLDGFGGPMQTIGYMDGFMDVVS